MTHAARQTVGPFYPLGELLPVDGERPTIPGADLPYHERKRLYPEPFDFDAHAIRLAEYYRRQVRFFAVSFPGHERSHIDPTPFGLARRLHWIGARARVEAEANAEKIRAELARLYRECRETTDPFELAEIIGLIADCWTALARITLAVLCPETGPVWTLRRTLSAGGQTARFAPLN